MKIGTIITIAAAFGSFGIASTASADGVAPALCGVGMSKTGGLETVSCASSVARPTGRLVLHLDAASRARQTPDPLSTSELGRRQLNALIASL